MSEAPGLILVLITPDGPGSGGGTQQVLRRMIPSWISEGRAVTLLTYPVDERWEGLPDSVEMIELPRPDGRAMHSATALLRNFVRILRTALTIRKAAQSRPGSVVLPFLPGAAILTLATTIGLRSRIIPCERNDPTRQRFGLTVRLLRRLLYRRAAAITVNTTVARDAFERLLRGRVPVHVVLNPLPDWPPASEDHREQLIVSVGRLVPQKRHDDVIRAFAAISNEHPYWRLEIVGDGPERPALEQLITDLGVADRVVLRGHVTDMRGALLRARLFVLASSYEGTSNAVVEALMANVPVVMSDRVPALPEALQEHRMTTRYSVGDIVQLVEILRGLMLHPQHDRGSQPLLDLEHYRVDVPTSWAKAL